MSHRFGLHSLSASVLLSLVATTAVFAQDISVTLLGTGSPSPALDRFGPSTLIEAGGQTFIFDAGRGALQRLSQVGVSFGAVQAVFLTHLHSDHIVGLPDLWLTGWLVGRRDRPLRMFGPAGTTEMMAHLTEAFRFDLRIRVEDNGRSPAGAEVQVTDIKQGVIYEAQGVRVTAFEADHGPVSPAFGYRLDYAGRSVVLSGDTRFSTNLIKFADQADLVIHEVADEGDRHTTPQEAGKVFDRVRPKLAVYSHILYGDLNELVARTRDTYSGPLVVGEDLMRFVVGSAVAVHPPTATTRK